MQYYSFDISQWLVKTAHLSPHEEGILLRLVNYYYDTEEPLPKDLSPVMRRLRIDDVPHLVKAIVEEYFELRGEGYYSRDCDKQLRSQRNQSRKPATKPDDVEESVWEDFLQLRRKLKAPLTQTAMKRLKTEAEKARLPLNEVLKVCCMRGWRGFEASWLTTKSTPNQAAARAIFGDERAFNEPKTIT